MGEKVSSRRAVSVRNFHQAQALGRGGGIGQGPGLRPEDGLDVFGDDLSATRFEQRPDDRPDHVPEKSSSRTYFAAAALIFPILSGYVQ
jgi:hypothetical protein